MDSWTGNALVCLYCTRPKMAPMRHMKMPKYMRLMPLTPHRPLNLTVVRSGIFMSASPAAKALVPRKDKQITANIHISFLAFLIHFEGRHYAKAVGHCQPFFGKVLTRYCDN